MHHEPLLALWTRHPGDLLGSAIDFLTHATGQSQAQHAGWLRRDGVTIHEAYYPHVRNRPLLASEKPFIRLFRVEGMTPALADRFEEFFDLAVDPRFREDYSVKGLFGFLFNVPPPDEQSVFCSEYCMQTIRKLAPSLLPLSRCEDYQVSPRDLIISPRLIEVDFTVTA